MLPIIYQDERVVAIHKPSGLLVHRSELSSGTSWVARGPVVATQVIFSASR